MSDSPVYESQDVAEPERADSDSQPEQGPLEARIVEARMKLRERWRAKTLATRARSDPNPGGSGPPNRHGMPQLPPGQRVTSKWPVLDLGRQPKISREEWNLKVDGLVEQPLQLSWLDFQALEQIEDVSDFHCVTGWSKLDVTWRGVRFSAIAEAAQVREGATHVVCHGYDGYTTNLPLEEALKSDVLLVYSADSQPLTREHGGPVRMITPQLYAWKGTKWIARLEFIQGDRLGYWERNGYSNTAHPWQEDRYSSTISQHQRYQPFIAPILKWLGAVLVISCALLIWARTHGYQQLGDLIEGLSLLAALGAVPYAIRTAR